MEAAFLEFPEYLSESNIQKSPLHKKLSLVCITSVRSFMSFAGVVNLLISFTGECSHPCGI